MSNLVIKNCVTIKDDGTELYIEFREATGDYSTPDNEGGFGAPNPARNTLAILLVAVHRLVDGDQSATILEYNPLTVESFTITLSKAVNGVLKFDILAFPIFDDEGVYEDGDIVYDNTTNPTSPFIKEMVDSEWVEKPLTDFIGDADVDQGNDYAFPIPDATQVKNELLADKLDKLDEYVHKKCGKHEYEVLRDQYDYVDSLIRAGINAFRAEAYNEAQKRIEEVFNFESQVLTTNG